MSYLVEVSQEDHCTVLRDTLTQWAKESLDVNLISTEGHKISTSAVLLSLYSEPLRDILNQPVLAYSSTTIGISIPASSSTISSLLQILSTGRAGSSFKDSLADIKDLAKSLGINIRNCFADNRKGGGKGLTVIKLPLNSESVKNIPVSKPKPQIIKTFSTPLESSSKPKIIKTFSTSKQSASNPQIIKTFSTSKDSTTPARKWNTSLINKSSKLRIELKEFTGEETQKVEPNIKVETTNTSGYPTCDMCGKAFKDVKYLQRHRYRKHGLKRKQAGGTTGNVKQEKVSTDFPNQCTICFKVFNTPEMLTKHIRKKHTDRATRYQCDVCQKFRSSKSELNMHKLIHLPESERPHKCDLCEKRFCQKGQKKVHMAKYHGNEDQDKTVEVGTGPANEPVIEEEENIPPNETLNEVSATAEQDPFADSNGIYLDNDEDPDTPVDNCFYCGEKFENESDLNQHIVDIHS